MEGDFEKSRQKLIGDGEEVNFDKKLVDVNPIVHEDSEVALKHARGGGEGGVNRPLAKIQTTKAVDLKLGTFIK